MLKSCFILLSRPLRANHRPWDKLVGMAPCSSKSTKASPDNYLQEILGPLSKHGSLEHSWCFVPPALSFCRPDLFFLLDLSVLSDVSFTNMHSRSLGCILYELFAGTPPFYTNNIFQLVNLICKVFSLILLLSLSEIAAFS